jgi:co-chaperonin GroES (HSP10)
VQEDGKELIIVGDRVLIDPAIDDRTSSGLLLPATAIDKNPVQAGWIKAIGPGTPVADPRAFDDEPWKATVPQPRYIPSQAAIGDQAIFFRRAAVEIEYGGQRYLIVPQSAILLLIRQSTPIPDTWPASE